jgi:hypothetical protein
MPYINILQPVSPSNSKKLLTPAEPEASLLKAIKAAFFRWAGFPMGQVSYLLKIPEDREIRPTIGYHNLRIFS